MRVGASPIDEAPYYNITICEYSNGIYINIYVNIKIFKHYCLGHDQHLFSTADHMPPKSSSLQIHHSNMLL